MEVRLIEAGDDDFAWMLGEGPGGCGLRLPPGGVDAPEILSLLRDVGAALRDQGQTSMWMIVADDEVVGLCGYKGLIDPDGTVEIGYGVAAGRRRQGHATAAITHMVAAAATDPQIRRLVAESAVGNDASRRVLAHAGFASTGRRTDPEEGELDLWRLDLGDGHLSPCVSAGNP